jgi:hypothetical protein
MVFLRASARRAGRPLQGRETAVICELEHARPRVTRSHGFVLMFIIEFALLFTVILLLLSIVLSSK